MVLPSRDNTSHPKRPSEQVVTPNDAVLEAMRMLEIDRMTVQVTSALSAAGIPSILLKGPALARWLYDDLSARPYIDCDLLVPPDRIHDAEGTLARMGFRRSGFDVIEGDRPKYAVPLRRDDGPQLDLHRTLVGIGAPDDRLWAELSVRTERMQLGDTEVDVLAPPARALVLGLHAMKDGGRSTKVLGDLETAAERVSLETWREAATLAERLEALNAFAAGLRRIRETARIADVLALPGGIPEEVALRLDAPPPLAVGLHWFLGSGRRGKGRFLLRKMFPPKAFMQAWSPLARKGRFGLVIAYLWRPLWLLRRIMPAVVAVIRAKRTSSPSAHDASALKREPPLKIGAASRAILATRIWGSFLRVRMELRRYPLPVVVRRLDGGVQRGAIPLHPRRVGRIVDRVLTVGRWRARCLHSSLVLYRLLRMRGDPAVLVIGMPERPEDEIAHAWVEIDGMDVGPPPGSVGHQQLARFP